jgi:hypothetical protein
MALRVARAPLRDPHQGPAWASSGEAAPVAVEDPAKDPDGVLRHRKTLWARIAVSNGK